MAENPYFSYTKRDYEGSRKEGISKIPMISNGRWTDLNATDPGIIIIDYVHALVDMMNYYQDHQALETFIVTAKERENIFRLAKQFSYKIRSAKGATVDVNFQTTLPYDHPIRIPKYTVVQTAAKLTYMTTKEEFLPAGQVSINIPCVQGELSTVTYTGTGISRYSEEGYDQFHTLLQTNVDTDTITIVDDTSHIWSPIEYMAFATENERVYEVDLDYKGKVTIKFGYGDRGYVPQPTDILTIKYITNQGKDGSIGASEIVSLVDPVYDGEVMVPFIVTNYKASTGGSDVQSSSEIRERIPGFIKAQDRAVTLDDFTNLAKNVEGIHDAKAYDINIAPDICQYHEVKVLIIPEDSYKDALSILQTNVYKYLSKRMIPPTKLSVLIPEYVPINITLRIKAYEPSMSDEIEYYVREVVQKYFRDREGAIGDYFYPAELLSKVSAVDSVRYIMSITPSEPVQVQEFAIAALGDLQIIIE